MPALPVLLSELPLLRQVVESSVVGTVIVDALQNDQPIMYVNPAFERLTGYPAAEILGRNCRFLQNQDHDQPGVPELRRAIERQQSLTVTLRNYRKDGTLFYNELTLSPVRDAAGTVTHFVGFQNDVTAREEAYVDEAQAHQQLRSTFERITDGFVSFDQDLNFTYLNTAAASVSGKRPEDLTGHNLLTTFPDLADSAVIQAVQKARATGTTQSAMSYLEPFGRWLEVTAYPAEDGISVFTRDVTERHQAQEQLQVSEKRFSSVFRASPMPMVITRVRDQQFIDVNEAFVHQSGYTREEAIGQSSQDLGLWVDQHDRDSVTRVVEEGSQVQRREVRLRTKSGEEHDMILSVVMVELDGEPCVVNLARDITHEKHAQRILEESEERYRQIAIELQRTLDLSLDLITSIDAEGRFLTMSAASQQILGYAPEELLGRSSLDFIHPDDQARTTQADASITAGQARTFFQNRYLHKNGSVVWMEWAAVVRPGDRLMYCVARDITVRRAADLQIQQQLRHITGLREIDQAIASSQDLPITLGLILENVTQQLGADAVTLLLLDPHTLNLEYAGTRGFATPLQGSTVRLGNGLAGEVALSRQPRHVPDVQHAPLVRTWREILTRERLMSYYGVPLMAKGKVLGVIEVLHREPFEPSATWLETFEMLTAQAAIAVDNAQLFAELERKNLELRLAYDETIEGWAGALDLRDKETEGHSRRVTEMTVRLCQQLGLSSEKLVDVRRGALLHDIGKMGIPDAVLLKPGKLTDEEWVLMKQHPGHAVKLLSPIKFLRPALDIPQYHHEKWDGSGYPVGLKGEAIPLTARAFAVVDVYDALTSDRPYRAAWTRERALEHIYSGAGSHFDPGVVEAFFQLLSSHHL